MSELVRIRLENIKEAKKVTVQKIDNEHANVRAGWSGLGKPETLLPAQVKELENISKLVKEPLRFDFKDKILSLELEVPAQGVAFILIETV